MQNILVGRIHWTLTELARACGVKRQTLEQYIKRGHFPAAEAKTKSGTPLWSEHQAEQVIERFSRRS